jgi:hypothetical protein
MWQTCTCGDLIHFNTDMVAPNDEQRMERTDHYTTSSINLGHTNFVEPTLILMMIITMSHINFQPTLNF